MIPLAIALGIIGVVAMIVWGVASGVLCNSYIGNESEFYVCDQSNSNYCDASWTNTSDVLPSYTFNTIQFHFQGFQGCSRPENHGTTSDGWKITTNSSIACCEVFGYNSSNYTDNNPDNAGQLASDYACCRGMYISGHASCITQHTATNCKEYQATIKAGGFMLGMAGLGCIISCFACMVCNGYFQRLEVLQAQQSGYPPGQVYSVQPVVQTTPANHYVAYEDVSKAPLAPPPPPPPPSGYY